MGPVTRSPRRAGWRKAMSAIALRPVLALLPLALATGAGAATGQSPPPAGLQPGDVQAVFETLLYRGCQRQVGTLLQAMERELPSLTADEAMRQRICGCTVKAAATGPRMKAVFDLPPDQLRTIGDDPEVMEYLKAKTAVSLLRCTGHAFDQMLDPAPKAR